MKWGFVLWLLLVAMAACGGGGESSEPAAGGGSGDDNGGGEVEQPADDGPYEAAPATNYVHVYQITNVDTPIDPMADDTITLDDGSVWEVTFGISHLTWLAFNDVIVCYDWGYKIFNLDRENDVQVSWAGGPTPEDCPKYTVSEILEDGQLLKLSDGSYWSISSFDAYDTKYWDSVFDDIVITEDQKLFNLDDEEIVDGTRLN